MWKWVSVLMPERQGDAAFLLVSPYSCPTATALLGPGVLGLALRGFCNGAFLSLSSLLLCEHTGSERQVPGPCVLMRRYRCKGCTCRELQALCLINHKPPWVSEERGVCAHSPCIRGRLCICDPGQLCCDWFCAIAWCSTLYWGRRVR